jgi:hypothetical protein
VEHDFALLGECDQVGQIRVGADEVPDDRDLTQDKLDGGQRDGAAVADQVVRASSRPDHGSGETTPADLVARSRPCWIFAVPGWLDTGPERCPVLAEPGTG